MSRQLRFSVLYSLVSFMNIRLAPNSLLFLSTMHTVEGKFTGYKRSLPPSEEYLRATGPKTVHAEKTLYFYHPEQYKVVKAARRALEKQLSQQLGLSPTHKPRKHANISSITIHSLDFEPKR